MNELRIRTLGGLEMALGDRPLAGSIPMKGRALVAYLAVSGGSATRTRLAGLLWSDLPESVARANLRLTLTKLRPSIPHMQADRTSVYLDQPWRVDVSALEGLAGGSADPTEVLDIARGEFLPGMEFAGAELFEEWAAAERARLRAMALALLDDVVGRSLAGGAMAVGVAAARRILEVEPANEHTHRALMRLFAAGGQVSAALAQFDTCQYVLFDELGEPPAEETAALADDIRRSASIAALPSPAGLPRPGTSFVGRQAELDHLQRLIDDPAYRLVTVVGPGGIGKTRLALEFAARRQTAGGQAVFVSFAGTPPASGHQAHELVVSTVAGGLGIGLTTGRDPFDVLVEQLSDRDLLLVADNLEHLAGAGHTLGRLLNGAERFKVLATSRRRLDLGAEWVVQLDGLAMPPPDAPGDLLDFDAVRLFTERARAAGAGDRLDLHQVASLCRAVGGIPLAIELAARRVPTVPLAEIRDRLGADLDLLAGAADPDRRHRSVRATLDWSWELLDRPVARSFAQLSVFPSGFSAAAAEAVADVDVVHLAELTEQSLLKLADDARYQMHQLVRQYAAEHLADDPDQAAALAARHASWIAAQMADSDPRVLDMLDIDDVRATTGWMLEHADAEQLSAYVSQLLELYSRRSYWSELRTIAEAALETKASSEPGSSTTRPSGPPPRLRADWLAVSAEAHRQIGKPDDATRLLYDALATMGQAAPESTAGLLCWMVGHAATLAAHRVGFHRSPQRRQVARVRSSRLLTLAELLFISEQADRILPISVGGFVEGQVSADAATQAGADGMAALVATVAGWHGIARRYTQRAVARAASAGVSPSVAAVAFLAAEVVTLGSGAWDDVMAHSARAIEFGRVAAQHRIEEYALLLEGIARYHIGGHGEAMALVDRVAARAGPRGSTVTLMWAHIAWAETGVRMGLMAQACDRARETMRLAERLEQRIDVIRARVVLARAVLAGGQPGDAERLLAEAAHELGDRPSYTSYSVEAHAGIPELALDLIDAGHGDPRALEEAARHGLTVLRRYTRAVPIALARVHLIEGRLARMHGHERAASKSFQRAARHAEQLAMPWELAEARRRLTADTAA